MKFCACLQTIRLWFIIQVTILSRIFIEHFLFGLVFFRLCQSVTFFEHSALIFVQHFEHAWNCYGWFMVTKFFHDIFKRFANCFMVNYSNFLARCAVFEFFFSHIVRDSRSFIQNRNCMLLFSKKCVSFVCSLLFRFLASAFFCTTVAMQFSAPIFVRVQL